MAPADKQDRREKSEKDKFKKRITVTFTEVQYRQVDKAFKEAQEEQDKLGLPLDAATYCRMLLLKATAPK